MTNWLLSRSVAHFEASRARGFDVGAIEDRHRDAWDRVRPGDRVVYHLVEADAVGGIARVTGDPYEDPTPLWSSADNDDAYGLRFPMEPTAVCEPRGYVPVEPLLSELELTRGVAGDDWRAAFAPGVHELTDADTEVLEGAVRLRSGATPTA